MTAIPQTATAALPPVSSRRRAAFDASGNGGVEINELIAAVNNALTAARNKSPPRTTDICRFRQLGR
jgi:hypothetical protein